MGTPRSSMSSSTWRVRRGDATYQRPPMSMMAWGEMGTFAAHRPLSLSSLFTLSHKGRAYLKSPQMKTCDRTKFVPEHTCLLPGASAPPLEDSSATGILLYTTL